MAIQQDTVRTALTSAVPNNGTVTLAYPNGMSQANYIGQFAAAGGQAVVESNDVYLESAGKISLAYGTSNITLTNLSGGAWAANAGLRVGLARQVAAPVTALKAAATTSLTDNSGGTASNTIAAITDVPTRNAVASLAATLNAVITALKNAGLTS